MIGARMKSRKSSTSSVHAGSAFCCDRYNQNAPAIYERADLLTKEMHLHSPPVWTQVVRQTVIKATRNIRSPVALEVTRSPGEVELRSATFFTYSPDGEETKQNVQTKLPGAAAEFRRKRRVQGIGPFHQNPQEDGRMLSMLRTFHHVDVYCLVDPDGPGAEHRHSVVAQLFFALAPMASFEFHRLDVVLRRDAPKSQRLDGIGPDRQANNGSCSAG